MHFSFSFCIFTLTVYTVLHRLLIIRNCLFQICIQSWILTMTPKKTILQAMIFSSVFKNPLKPASLYFILKGNIQIDHPRHNCFMAFILLSDKMTSPAYIHRAVLKYPEPSLLLTQTTFMSTVFHFWIFKI